MRYFARELNDGSLAPGLYRFEVGENSMIEQYWSDGWHHDDQAKVVGWLILGENDLKELSLDEAKLHRPDAFDSPRADFVHPRTTPGESSGGEEYRPGYKVIFVGSSLIGASFGEYAYNAAVEFLQAKSDAGKIKCFKWWCEKCKTMPFAQGDSPEGHVIEVSIPNVLKISEGQEVDWIWDDPESDWAKSRGISAAQEFQSLVDRKSRPNWKIIIKRD